MLQRFLPYSTVLAGLALAGACGRADTQQPDAGAPLAVSPAAAGVAAPAPADTIDGTVLETMNASGYTYLKLHTVSKGDVWVAASQFTVEVGEKLSVLIEVPMRNFHSATLNRDFPVIYFVPAVAREGQSLPQMAPAGASEPGSIATPASSHTSGADAAVAPVSPPAGGLSIAEIWARRKTLAGKPVTIRGQVVKVNNGILGRNWLHVQDGSGKAADQTNDLTVTTSGTAVVGDVVTVTGTLAVAKDFGAGYSYEAIIEGGTLTQ